MAILKIGTTKTNLVPLTPDPSALTLGLQDIDASTTTRSADGTMLRDRVCGGATAKRKLNLEWAYIGNDDARVILRAIQNEFFWVEYDDPFEPSGRRVAEFYAGDRSLPMYNAVIKNGSILWEKLTVDLIEK